MFHLARVKLPIEKNRLLLILAPLAFAGISLVGLYGVAEKVYDQPGVLEVPVLRVFKAPILRDRYFLWLVGLGFAASALTSIINHG